MLIQDLENIISKAIELYESGQDFNYAFFTARNFALKEKPDSCRDSISYEIYSFIIDEMIKKSNNRFNSIYSFSEEASKETTLDFLYYLQKLSKLLIFK